ncbi:Uncharacterised protein [Klebsiella pneumoniae]|uniref:hypothetical protein n=1 Tax=Klebsiella pneumoniae complex TaxID=3390273 RepID=UPI000E2A61DB|nr:MULTISPECIES: hypothetical protein [Klebsiella]EKW2602578.1 hypothetical protein [Klebsiella quasipneumoniae]QYD23391.1 hypothetical protein KZX49_10335 [Klebsiella quasipneumoniae]SXA02235.1 Uncharacterised protein [Klebsiella pneumoniae]
MTDITELAHREKFEAWWERTQHNGNPPRFGWSHWRDGEGYKVDDDNSELDGMWSAWKAAGAELVEALEKAQQRIDSQREYYDGVIADGGKRIAELESRTVKLPKPHAHLIWIQAGHAPDDYWDDVEVSHSEKDRCCDGSERYPVYARWEIEEMLAAAGIKVEAE